jgi:hypothetical protein
MNETLEHMSPEHLSIDDIIEHLTALEGVLVLQPGPGDGAPEVSWGDVFFYYAPDGEIPRTQPFATVVTKDYPDDRTSRLDRPGAFRLNVHVEPATFRELTGRDLGETADPDVDPSTVDVLFAHPVYGRLSWLAVVNPGAATARTVLELLATAHANARNRYRRRQGDQTHR